jgi:hypothetical protein
MPSHQMEGNLSKRGRLCRIRCSRSISHVDFVGSTVAAGKMLCMLVGGMLLLYHDFPGIELHEHRAVRFKLFHRNRQSKIVQEEKLQLQMI